MRKHIEKEVINTMRGKQDEIRVKMCGLNNLSSVLCFALLVNGAYYPKTEKGIERSQRTRGNKHDEGKTDEI